MQLECPHCRQVLEFSQRRPAFCSYCGRALLDTDLHLATTVPPSSIPPAEDLPADVPAWVGEYRLVRELGRGGMGRVWEAEQAGTGRRVALKLLSPDLARAPEAMARFLREGRLAAALSHPRSTFVFGAGEQDGWPYIVMELMPGQTLLDLVSRDGPLSVNRAVDHVLDVIAGLEAAHALGIIHRDVKPSNCFLDSDGRVKVGDFGLSKSLVDDTNLTRTGTFMGTPLFAAPEQVRGGTVDERTDIYSVGATLFYLIARRGPFNGDPAAVIAQIVSDPAPPLRSLCPTVPQDLDLIIARTLQKNPDRRYARLAQLRQALLPFATGGTSIADLGRRLGAYMVDALVVGMASGFVSTVYVIALEETAGTRTETSARYATAQVIGAVVEWILQVAYFTIAEGRWGHGVGKLLLGLRVVGAQGDPAGLGRSLLRSLFIPGALGLTLVGSVWMLWVSGETGAIPHLDLWLWLRAIALEVLVVLAQLSCLTTMRAWNGYRGLHELASGTRVVRLRSATDEYRPRETPVVVPVEFATDTGKFGPFRTVGTVRQGGPVTVLQARDDALGRAVWIRVSAPGMPPLPAERTQLARPTRPRWLQGGVTDGVRWDAFEAVLGAPLSDAARAERGLTWERGRFVLLELTEELLAAVADDTLPTPLTLDQVWIDRSGRVKLLDSPIRPASTENAPAPELPVSTPERALTLLRAATDLCSQRQVLPGHAQDFVQALATRPADKETLSWAVQQLRELCQRTARLRWDDRLGILGVTTGTEYTFYWLTGLLVALLTWSLTKDLTLRIVPPLLVDVALPAVLAFWLRGAPVFRFLGIEVRRADGKPASRLRCAWRNVVAWVPLLMVNAWLPFTTGGESYTFEPHKPPPLAAVVLLFYMCAGSCLAFVAIVAAIYGVVRPQRGIPDLLAGTCLVPR